MVSLVWSRLNIASRRLFLHGRAVRDIAVAFLRGFDWRAQQKGRPQLQTP
jgi:hypothetical protein